MEGSLKVGNLDVPYVAVEGEVVEVRLLSETHVSGYGGGGVEDQFGNFSVNPIEISSRVRNRAHAVVRWESGKEGNFVADAQFAMRNGHRLLAITLSREGVQGRAYVYNHNTGQLWTEGFMGMQRKAGVVLFPLALGVFGAVVCFLGAVNSTYTANSHGHSDNPVGFVLGMILLPLIGIIFAIVGASRQSVRNARTKEVNAAFAAFLPELAAQIEQRTANAKGA